MQDRNDLRLLLGHQPRQGRGQPDATGRRDAIAHAKPDTVPQPFAVTNAESFTHTQPEPDAGRDHHRDPQPKRDAEPIVIARSEPTAGRRPQRARRTRR